jgi:hypothetical protein
MQTGKTLLTADERADLNVRIGTIWPASAGVHTNGGLADACGRRSRGRAFPQAADVLTHSLLLNVNHEATRLRVA